jgi:hypothetical protein
MTMDKANYIPKKISFNVPTYLSTFPDLKKLDLTPTEQKLYLQLSLEYQIILDGAPSFQMGAYKWNKVLPQRLEMYGITSDEWERISEIGDSNDAIQDQLQQLAEKLEKTT